MFFFSQSVIVNIRSVLIYLTWQGNSLCFSSKTITCVLYRYRYTETETKLLHHYYYFISLYSQESSCMQDITKDINEWMNKQNKYAIYVTKCSEWEMMCNWIMYYVNVYKSIRSRSAWNVCELILNFVCHINGRIERRENCAI